MIFIIVIYNHFSLETKIYYLFVSEIKSGMLLTQKKSVQLQQEMAKILLICGFSFLDILYRIQSD